MPREFLLRILLSLVIFIFLVAIAFALGLLS